MRIRLPYSRKKRYLSGMDWIVATLNHMNHLKTGGSNASQVVLELNGVFDAAKFKLAVADVARLFPVLGGRIARCWNLAPYWKMPPAGDPATIPVEIRDVTGSTLHAALVQSVNACFSGPDSHLAFRLFRLSRDHHYLALRFDHCLLDAQGAEMLLDLLHCRMTGEDCSERIAKLSFVEPPHLSEWMRKFEAGKQLIRMLLPLTKKMIPTLPRPSPLQGRIFRFEVIEFNERETESIMANADREAGFMMLMPYLLATSLASLDQVFKAGGRADGDYLVSVSVDLRTPDTAAARLFFNHMSFLFFTVPAAVAGDRRQTLVTFKQQMYEQIKSGFPGALAESSMLMRILPRSLLGRIMLKPLHGEFASFNFAFTGKGRYRHGKFMDADVVNLFHMPLVPVPPGLGVVFNQHGKRMNAALSYLDGIVEERAAGGVAARMRETL